MASSEAALAAAGCDAEGSSLGAPAGADAARSGAPDMASPAEGADTGAGAGERSVAAGSKGDEACVEAEAARLGWRAAPGSVAGDSVTAA
jgi:hypothetical protein